MDRVRIKAREHIRNKKKNLREPPQHAMPDFRDEGEARNFTHAITVRYSTDLHSTIQNIIESAHITQDFTFVSPSDFIRAALRAYRTGMALTELSTDGAKRETKLRVDDELYHFYQSLPKGVRSKLLERALRTLIKNM